jgi:acyl-CoA thioester hydrolase
VKKKIYYHDTDCGGVVYYANYLAFLEEARTEFLAERGISIKDWSERGILFVVARTEIDYKAPAFYGDILDIEVKLANISAVKLEYDHLIKNQKGQVVVQAKAVLVCVGKDFKPMAMPEDIREIHRRL